MSVTLLFVRHAQSGNNAKSKEEGKEGGREPDPSITPVGVRQAEVLAAYLREVRDDPHAPLRVDRVLTSPMARTLETLRPVCAALGLPAHVVADLHEQGGVFPGSRQTASPKAAHAPLPGLTCSQIKAAYPFVESFHGVDDGGWWNKGYESFEDTVDRANRMVAMFKDLATTCDGQTVLVMTHGWFLEFVVKAFLGIPLPQAATAFGPVYMPTYCTSLTVIRLVAPTERYPEWSIGFLMWNAIPHLRHYPELVFGSSRGPIDC